MGVKFDSASSGTALLLLQRITPADAGSYLCLATGGKRFLWASNSLNVVTSTSKLRIRIRIRNRTRTRTRTRFFFWSGVSHWPRAPTKLRPIH